MERLIRIGTRESQLAVWQATEVKKLLALHGYGAQLVYIKSDGDTDLKTPLYELGVQGIFTKALDIALLNNEIDVAVHSMKDVPTVLAKGVLQAAVLPRASVKDILVPENDTAFLDDPQSTAVIATSSTRRRAQWLHRFPGHRIESLRGNVNTRLQKIQENDWHGAIFAAAGLERIGLRPANAIDLDWMLPAPAQGAIVVVCKDTDTYCAEACALMNDKNTALCVAMERAFLRALLGGCSTPISALSEVKDGRILFRGNILSTDGKLKKEIVKEIDIEDIEQAGASAAMELLSNGGDMILEGIRNDR